MSKQKKILADHKLVNKKLKPPIMQGLPGWETHFIEVPYIDKVLPEIIWISILNDKHGVTTASDLTLNLLKAIDESFGEKSSTLFSFLSNFETLHDTQISHVKRKCLDELSYINDSLSSFYRVFPDCPLIALDQKGPGPIDSHDIEYIKQILDKLLDKVGKETTFSLSTVIYHAFELHRLTAFKDASILKLNKIHLYPTTEESKIIASTIRSTVNMFIGSEHFLVNDSKWSKYFWNRAHAIAPNNIDSLILTIDEL